MSIGDLKLLYSLILLELNQSALARVHKENGLKNEPRTSELRIKQPHSLDDLGGPRVIISLYSGNDQ